MSYRNSDPAGRFSEIDERLIALETKEESVKVRARVSEVFAIARKWLWLALLIVACLSGLLVLIGQVQSCSAAAERHDVRRCEEICTAYQAEFAWHNGTSTSNGSGRLICTCRGATMDAGVFRRFEGTTGREIR